MQDRPQRSKRGTLAGELAAGHELLHVLAAGGMGEVYVARHQVLGMLRAVKVIRADMRGRERSHERFVREAQVLAKLQHNSIVNIVEFGEMANGWPFLVMEYISGVDLDVLVDQGPVPLADALVVVEQLALALHYAHSRGVIHRDLKPSNVLLRGGDVRQVKIIDFGLARLLDEDARKRLTVDGQLIGSPAYMAPEQVDGDPDVTGAVDVYALAGIAYKLLSGSPPFGQRPSLMLMTAHKHEKPPSLSEMCRDIPDMLDMMLLACLAKEPTHRPRAEEVANRIGRLVRGTPISPRAAVPVERMNAPDETVTVQHADLVIDVIERAPPTPQGLAIATRIMALIGQIVSFLSASDPELGSLLQLEARIREQLDSVERERASIVAQIEAAGTPTPSALEMHRDNLGEQLRTLKAQQMPLQRRMVDVAERHRRYATGAVKALFDQIDGALEELRRTRA